MSITPDSLTDPHSIPISVWCNYSLRIGWTQNWVITGSDDVLSPIEGQATILTYDDLIWSGIAPFWARFLSLPQSKLRLCSANHRPGYWSNLPCDWLSTAWAYSEEKTENRPWSNLKQWWCNSLMEKCVNSLRPCDTVMRQLTIHHRFR